MAWIDYKKDHIMVLQTWFAFTGFYGISTILVFFNVKSFLYVYILDMIYKHIL